MGEALACIRSVIVFTPDRGSARRMLGSCRLYHSFDHQTFGETDGTYVTPTFPSRMSRRAVLERRADFIVYGDMGYCHTCMPYEPRCPVF